MARSHREVFSFGVAIIVLSVGVVVSMNCDNSNVSPVVPFCSNQSTSGRNVYLSGIDVGTNGAGCNCSITITPSNQYPVKIEIRNVTTGSNLCDYSLHSVYKTINTKLYSCGENVNKAGIENLNKAGISLDTTKTVRLHMEIGTYNGVGFPFCLELYTGTGSGVILKCRSNSTTTTTSPEPSTHKSSTNRNISIVIHSTTTSQPNSDDSDRMIGIIIGSILAVLVVFALVITIVCLVERRKKKPPYETPMEPQDRRHNHVNESITPKNNANGHKNQNTRVGSQGMIYLENDLYNSMDDDVPVGRKGGNHEGMIYLENDLYISSNGTDNVHQDAENSVPHQPVEYAVVNKTPKKSSSSDGASTGQTVGPHGDVYTLVQKK